MSEDAPRGARPGAPARELALAFAIYAALTALLFVPALAGNRVFAFRDLADYAIPHKVWAAAELSAGRVPLWNPFDYCGFPHLANLQSGVLYPPNLLLLWLPFPLGFNLSLVVHFILAGLGARALARALGVAAGPALVAGIAYGFSPYLLSLTDLNAFLATSSWLPWLLAAGLRLGADATPRAAAGAVIVFAMAFLGGEPQTLAVGALLAGLASLWQCGRRPGPLARVALMWGLAAFATLLLVAPVLLPFLELASLSERGGAGLAPEQVYRYSVEPRALLTLVLPGFAGDVVAGSHWLGAQTYVRSPYLGTVVLALALAGAVGAGRGRAGLVLVAVVGVLLALGPDGLLYPLLYALGFRQSRFPVKFLVLTVLALAPLAARGAEMLGGSAGEARRARKVVGVGLALLLVLAVASALLAPAPAGVWAALRAAAAATAGLLVVALAVRHPASAVPRGLGCVLLAADLLAAAHPLLTTVGASELLQRPAALAAIRPAAEGEGGLPWPRIYTPPISLETLGGVYREGQFDLGAVERKKALLFGNTNLLFRLPVVRGGESMEIRHMSGFLDLVDRGAGSRALLDLAGAGWMVRAGPDGVAQVHVNPSPMPHAFFPAGITVREDPAALAELAAPGFDPRARAVVARELGLVAGCELGQASVTLSTPDRLRIEVDSPGRCLLVVTDTFYPGWEVRVDGQPAELLRANATFRGVLLGAGRQQIEMAFRPRSFSRGLKLAGCGALLLAALAALDRRLLDRLGWPSRPRAA